MKVVFLSQYFFPEVFSSTYLFYDVLCESKKAGNENIIIAPMPLRGVSAEDLVKYHIPYEKNEYGEVYRLPCYAGLKNSFIGRFFRMFSLIHHEMKVLKRLEQIDMVVVPSTPPLFLLRAVSHYAKKHKVKVIYNLHDLYPDILFAPASPFYGPLNHMLKHALKHVDLTVAISEDMRKQLINKGLDPTKIQVIHNWTRDDNPLPNDKNTKLRELKHKINYQKNKINLFYVGNLGVFQDMKVIVAAAKSLKEAKKIRFSIIGSGSRQKVLIKMLKKAKLDNIAYYPRVNQEEAEWLYQLADINLIPLKGRAILAACPSKTAMCLMAHKPVIGIVEASSIYADLFRSNGGYVVNSGDSKGLANTIRDIVFEDKPDLPSAKLIALYARDMNLALWQKIFTPDGNKL